MNRVFLIGNLTKDPEVNTTSNDLVNCKFSLAVTRRYNNSSGSKDTDFFSIICWRGLAENCGKYLRKGSKVGIVGTIQNKNYEASDGTKRYSTEIDAEEVQFLSTKNDNDDINELPEVASKPTLKVSELKAADDDDLPF